MRRPLGVFVSGVGLGGRLEQGSPSTIRNTGIIHAGKDLEEKAMRKMRSDGGEGGERDGREAPLVMHV